MTETAPPAKDTRQLSILRTWLGLSQGIAFYWLYTAAPHKAFPGNTGFVFAPLFLTALYIPVMALLGLGTIRLRTLVPMLVICAAALAALAYYDIWRVMDVPVSTGIFGMVDSAFLASARLVVLAAPALFAVQAFVTGADTDRRWIARYTTHFDVAWKLALQLQLAFSFLALLWLLLYLGAALFLVIHVDFFSQLISVTWFSLPVTALAFAAAIHLTDVRVALVRGMRTLVLALNSWLLPVLTAIVGAFLLTFLVTGLEPLWATQRATLLLLGAATFLIVLINAAYQDGPRERTPPAVLRLAGLAAAILLLPLIGLAAAALLLRVGQYGWTSDRIMIAACIVVGSVYAVGYALAALLTVLGLKPWLSLVEPANVASSFAAIVTIIALLSPIADPAKLSVANQLARLRSGLVTAEKFDYVYLRNQGLRFGNDALIQLAAEGKNIPASARQRTAATEPRYTPETIAAAYAVHGGTGTLPESFLQQDWKRDSFLISNCVRERPTKCDAFLADVNGDQSDDILLYDDNNVLAVSPNGDGRGVRIGQLRMTYRCAAFLDALRAGQYQLTPAEPSPFRDVVIGGIRLPFYPDIPPMAKCPAPANP